MIGPVKEFCLGLIDMSTFNFFTCKFTFHLSVHHIQVCEKYNLWRDERPMSSIEILGGLYMKPDRKIERYETEKSHVAFRSNL